MIELSEMLAFRRELPRHLRELGVLLGCPVYEEQLLSLVETEEIRAKSSAAIREPTRTFEIPFDAKRGLRFRTFVDHLALANPSNIYLWTPASNTCGLMKPVALSELAVDFPFDVNPDGILVILTSDYCERLLLDYSLDAQGQPRLELEVSGAKWGCIAY